MKTVREMKSLSDGASPWRGVAMGRRVPPSFLKLVWPTGLGIVACRGVFQTSPPRIPSVFQRRDSPTGFEALTCKTFPFANALLAFKIVETRSFGLTFTMPKYLLIASLPW